VGSDRAFVGASLSDQLRLNQETGRLFSPAAIPLRSAKDEALAPFFRHFGTSVALLFAWERRHSVLDEADDIDDVELTPLARLGHQFGR
jgi:hypothetical protein